MKYEGSIQDLEVVIAAVGRTIKTTDDKGSMYQIKTEEGETVNFYKTGTLQIQGSPALKQKLEDDLNNYLGNKTTISNEGKVPSLSESDTTTHISNSKQVFIVHGHDDTSREQLELILHKLGLDPFVLANTGGQGLTIIEALETKIGHNSDATSFGIVLMTPDDMGYSLNDGADSIEPRARQNVVLEMGMLISSIGRKNIAILVKGHLEKPSDADGILYIPFNNHVKEVVPRLASRLKDSGFILSPDKITHASS